MTGSSLLPLYSGRQVRLLDEYAIETLGIPALTLMHRAGLACWRQIQRRWPAAGEVDVVCGPGNNGGDGYVVARLAAEAGWRVRVWSVGEPRAPSTAAQARDEWPGRALPYARGVLQRAGLIVDALLGTGVSRPLQGVMREAVDEINAGSAPVLAVDLPSGLNADSGAVQGAAVHADCSVSFIGRKLGLYTGQGPAVAGERVFDDLGVAPDPAITAQAGLLQASMLASVLAPRPRDAHKGQHGHVLLVGGDEGMAGAILMAARAALRCGAGLVSVATRPRHAALLTAAQPEAMFHGVESAEALAGLLARASVVAVGPGMGRGEWGRRMWSAAVEADLPKVLDADALNLLAESPQTRADWILTPHPGEAARLLQRSVADIGRDRPGAVRELRDRFGGVVVLKGAGSLIRGTALAVCPYGNPGMATGGMGDVLTGIVAGLCAQHLRAETAAQAGVLLHALAGDRAAMAGERGLLPGDLLAELRGLANPRRA